MGTIVTRLIDLEEKQKHMNPEYISQRIKEIDLEVGHKIRQARQSKGLSQRELGSLIGCSFQQVQKYENGTNHVNVPRLILIAEALEVKIAELLLKNRGGQVPKSSLAPRSTISLAELSPTKQKLVREMVDALKRQKQSKIA